MSVINSVLKELDNRPTVFKPVTLSGSAPDTGARRNHHMLRLAIVVVVLSVIALYVYWSSALRSASVSAADSFAGDIPTGTIPESPAADSVLHEAVSNDSVPVTRVLAEQKTAEQTASLSLLTGLHLNESTNQLELWFQFDRPAQSYLQSHGANRYQFVLPHSENRVAAPQFNGDWIKSIELSNDDNGMQLVMLTDHGVAVSTREQKQGEDFFWIVQLRREPLYQEPINTSSAKVNAPAARSVTPVVQDAPEPKSLPQVRVEIKPITRPRSDLQKLEAADADIQAGHWQQAIDELLALLDSKLDLEVRHRLLGLYRNHGLGEAFVRLLQDTRQRYPQLTEFDLLDAQFKFDSKQFSSLVDSYAERRSPPALISLVAASYQRLGQHRQAVDAYQNALKLDPGQAKNWVSLGISQEQIGLPQQALQSYRESLKRGGLNPRLRQFVSGRVRALGGDSAA